MSSMTLISTGSTLAQPVQPISATSPRLRRDPTLTAAQEKSSSLHASLSSSNRDLVSRFCNKQKAPANSRGLLLFRLCTRFCSPPRFVGAGPLTHLLLQLLLLPFPLLLLLPLRFPLLLLSLLFSFCFPYLSLTQPEALALALVD